MTAKMVDEYKKLKEERAHLMYDVPQEKWPVTKAGNAAWMAEILDRDEAMKKIEKRLTYDEKKGLHLLKSQLMER